jgi:hypothetical protein
MWISLTELSKRTQSTGQTTLHNLSVKYIINILLLTNGDYKKQRIPQELYLLKYAT